MYVKRQEKLRLNNYPPYTATTFFVLVAKGRKGRREGGMNVYVI